MTVEQKTIVIGDIHGCLEEFAQLLDVVQFDENHHRLILLGDLIDRGPDPAGVVEYAKHIGAECVMGNHEEKALRWRRHEKRRRENTEKYKNPMRPINEARLAQWAQIPDKHWDWIESWPAYLHFSDKWTAVHAGAYPNTPIEQQDSNHLMRLRYIDTVKGKMVSPTERGEQPASSYHWTQLWKGPRSIIYGHYTYSSIAVRECQGPTRGEPVWTLGIDTGCVHGDSLSAIVFYPNYPGWEHYAVQAKKVYSERKPWNDEVE